MQEQEILNQVEDIFRSVLKKPGLTLSSESSANDVEGWDSLTHVILIDSIENHFRIKFKLMEIMGFNSLGDLCECVKKKLL